MRSREPALADRDSTTRSTASEEMLLAWRPEFPILEETTYLISNSLGAMPRGVFDAVQGYAKNWSERGVRAWEDRWWSMAMDVGDRVASLIRAAPGSVTTHANVTMASAVVASCFEFTGKRNRIVCSALNFPSIIYLYGGLERRGAELELVECPDGMTVPLDALLEAIDEHTKLVSISHVIFKSSYIQEVEAIVTRAHEVGAFVVLDTYQSVGSVPVDVQALNVDFAVGGTLKWLCGGPGVAYLYVRPDLCGTLCPSLTGWMAHEEAFAFEAGRQRYRTDGWRFLNGTPAIPALCAALPGLDILNQLDLSSVRAKSLRQTRKLMDAALEAGWPLRTPQEDGRRGGVVTLGVPDADVVTNQLVARDVLVDFRPDAGIRMAPHFYTTDEEVDRAIGALSELVVSQDSATR